MFPALSLRRRCDVVVGGDDFCGFDVFFSPDHLIFGASSILDRCQVFKLIVTIFIYASFVALTMVSPPWRRIIAHQYTTILSTTTSMWWSQRQPCPLWYCLLRQKKKKNACTDVTAFRVSGAQYLARVSKRDRAVVSASGFWCHVVETTLVRIPMALVCKLFFYVIIWVPSTRLAHICMYHLMCCFPLFIMTPLNFTRCYISKSVCACNMSCSIIWLRRTD